MEFKKIYKNNLLILNLFFIFILLYLISFSYICPIFQYSKLGK